MAGESGSAAAAAAMENAERVASAEPSRSRRGAAPRFRAVGFWSRFASGLIDALIVVPLTLVLAWLIGKIMGFGMPPSLGLDYWLDLALGHDPGMMAVLVILVATTSIYLFVFQATLGRTLGMRVLGSRVIDLYGDPPTVGRAALRVAGALACVVTLGLGLLWIGFDSEKRGLHDWIASTYVVKA